MGELPVHTVGEAIVIEERWHGLLWSAVPARVVSSSPEVLLGWVPAGARSVHATNRGLPEVAGMTRDERKLQALKTRRAVTREFSESPHKLSVFRPDRWATVNLGWDPADGRFLGWYVDFTLPVESTDCGLATKDLVLDLWVDADRSWRWKDREDFDTAISEGLFDAAIAEHLDREAELILDELGRGVLPFGEEFTTIDTSWPLPELPAAYAWHGSAWLLPPGDPIE